MSVEKVRRFFAEKGLEDRVIDFGESSATVELAAKAAGCETRQILKTLSFIVEEKPILVVAAGHVKISNPKFKATFQHRPKMIPAPLVEEYIGHDVGGVCPFAINPGVDVYLDVSLKQSDIIYTGGGDECNLIKLSVQELVEYSRHKEWVDVCKE